MTRSKVAKLPPLPATVSSLLGPIKVTRVPGLKDSNDKDCLGLWLVKTRDIHVEQAIALETAWHTLFHEWVHATLWDAGMAGLREDVEERIADALATARVREMLDNGGR